MEKLRIKLITIENQQISSKYFGKKTWKKIIIFKNEFFIARLENLKLFETRPKPKFCVSDCESNYVRYPKIRMFSIDSENISWINEQQNDSQIEFLSSSTLNSPSSQLDLEKSLFSSKTKTTKAFDCLESPFTASTKNFVSNENQNLNQKKIYRKNNNEFRLNQSV